jgi:4-hydroxybenzoate polyprenyltransferase
LELNQFALISTFIFAALYTLRVIAGAAAANTTLSFWLALHSALLFLSLAFAKRVAIESLHQQHKSRLIGRSYDIDDLLTLEIFAISARYLSVLGLALHINSPKVNIPYRRLEANWVLRISSYFTGLAACGGSLVVAARVMTGLCMR